MEEFKKELKELLAKHKANIYVEQDEDDSFLYLQLRIGDEIENMDSGYRDLIISEHSLKL